MPPVIKHRFASAKVDAPDPSLVRPSNWNDEHELEGSGWFVPGMIIDYAGHTVPDGFIEGYGQSVSAVDHPKLFSALVKQDTVVITTGSPGSVAWVDHGLTKYSKVRFTSSGTLPSGIAPNTDYYVAADGLTANSFRVADTWDGNGKTLGGTPSGTITCTSHIYGVSNDLSTFTIPDLRGRVVAGYDLMGGTSANRLTNTATGGVAGQIFGAAGGNEAHALIELELPPHQHWVHPPNPVVTITSITIGQSGSHSHSIGSHTHSFTAWTSENAVEHVHQILRADNTGTNGQALARGGGSGHTYINTSLGRANHSHSVSGTTAGASGTTGSAGTHTHTASGTATATIDGAFSNPGFGQSQPHNNVQPTIVMRKLLYAG